MEVVGNRVVIDLRNRAFLGADAAGKIAPVVDGQGDIGGHGLADRLAVVPGFGQRQHIEIVLHPLRNLVHDIGAMGGAGMAPALPRRVGRIERQLNILRTGARNLTESLPGDRGDVFKVLAGGGLKPLAADVIAVTRAKAHFIAELARMHCGCCRH